MLLVLVVVVAVRTWICMPALVSGSSMMPTLRDGQVVLVNKLAYCFHAPKRGEIVSIWTGRELMIKRIIGLPGEELSLHDGRLYVNGKVHAERYLDQPGELEIAGGKIPANSFAVAGDNRARTIVAIVHRKRIAGKLICRLARTES